MTLLCKDCKHAMPKWRWTWNWIEEAKCALSLSESKSFDPVTGERKIYQSYPSCYSQRFTYGACGADAKLWEPRKLQKIEFCKRATTEASFAACEKEKPFAPRLTEIK